jgi:hypothetical protein
MAVTETRAGQLAGLAHLDRLALPAPVTTAITGYENIMGLPVPAPPEYGADRRAITALADELARQAMLGKHPAAPPVPLDVTPIAAALQDDQAALARAALARELRAAAAAVLTQVFAGEAGQQVIRAVQARHAEVMAELISHARKLPEGADRDTALEAGGEIRDSYLAARDLTVLVAQLRLALALIEDPPVWMPDDLERCLAFERSGKLYATAWLAPSGISTHGSLGSLEFYLSACREPYEWWLPTAAELDARATEAREVMHVNRLQGLPPAHVF